MIIMDDIETMIRDKSEITSHEQLVEIQEQEQQVRPEDEERVLKVLIEGSFSRKDLRRRVRMKSTHFTTVVISLQAQNKVKVMMVPNSHGPDTELISAIAEIDNSPEAKSRRLNKLGMGIYHTERWS